jgi:hypothetical protein
LSGKLESCKRYAGRMGLGGGMVDRTA